MHLLRWMWRQRISYLWTLIVEYGNYWLRRWHTRSVCSQRSTTAHRGRAVNSGPATSFATDTSASVTAITRVETANGVSRQATHAHAFPSHACVWLSVFSRAYLFLGWGRGWLRFISRLLNHFPPFLPVVRFSSPVSFYSFIPILIAVFLFFLPSSRYASTLFARRSSHALPTL